MHPLSSWVFFQNRESSYKRMVYEILLYLHEIGFRSVLDGQSGEKSPSQGEQSASQGGAAPQPWEAPRGTWKITWTKITSNFLIQKTKESLSTLSNIMILSYYVLTAKYPDRSEVSETNMGTI